MWARIPWDIRFTFLAPKFCAVYIVIAEPSAKKPELKRFQFFCATLYPASASIPESLIDACKKARPTVPK